MGKSNEKKVNKVGVALRLGFCTKVYFYKYGFHFLPKLMD